MGHQETVEEMRAEKAEKYTELKGNRNDKEFDEWFLRYRPLDKKDGKKRDENDDKKNDKNDDKQNDKKVGKNEKSKEASEKEEEEMGNSVKLTKIKRKRKEKRKKDEDSFFKRVCSIFCYK
jgi:hypothetical protein